MDNIDMMVMNPDGKIIDLNHVRVISEIVTHEDRYRFSTYYVGLTQTDAIAHWDFFFSKHVDNKAELKIKVENIRQELGRRKNGGREIKPIINCINLKK